MADAFSFEPIGWINAPYKEKFGIPRQPGLAQSLISRIKLDKPYSAPEIVRGLEQCSHIWLIFVFSECVDAGWSPTVRPPRLGGNERMGVFATRAPFRPNPIGLSPVKLIAIEKTKQGIELVISGGDLLDGTPILDIKPYLPYTDKIEDAFCEFATGISMLEQPVKFTEEAENKAASMEANLNQPVKAQITELLKCDPRPAYKKDSAEKMYGVKLHDANIRFTISSDTITVHSIEN